MRSLIRTTPNDFDRLFDGLVNLQARSNVSHPWMPAVDVSESQDAYVFQFDLPGIDPKGVKIEMSNDTLTVKGERKSETVDPKSEVTHRTERARGSFERAFRLSVPVDTPKIKATYRDGVLDIRVPKLEQAKTREISIDVE